MARPAARAPTTQSWRKLRRPPLPPPPFQIPRQPFEAASEVLHEVVAATVREMPTAATLTDSLALTPLQSQRRWPTPRSSRAHCCRWCLRECRQPTARATGRFARQRGLAQRRPRHCRRPGLPRSASRVPCRALLHCRLRRDGGEGSRLRLCGRSKACRRRWRAPQVAHTWRRRLHGQG